MDDGTGDQIAQIVQRGIDKRGRFFKIDTCRLECLRR
jgi:hypothetical protein